MSSTLTVVVGQCVCAIYDCIYMFLYMYICIYRTVLKFIFMRYEQKSSMLVLYTFFQLAFTSCFVYYSSLLLRRCCRRCPLALKSPTFPLLIHTYIHTSQIHAYVCVSSICLYLPHRPHILDGTNRVLSCLLPCLFSTYGILCFKNVLHIVQYRQRVGVRQGACECERGRPKNSKALLQILCRIPLYNKEIRFSLEHICFSEYFPCIPIA